MNLAAAALVLGIAVARLWSAAHAYDRIVVEEARAAGIDPLLVSAVIWKESRYKADAVGEAGEIGLMQLMSAAAADWARAHRRNPPQAPELFDPRLNVRIGAWYLAKALSDWREAPEREERMLSQYNAGPTVARRWAKVADQSGKPFADCIAYPSTRLYVDHILRRYRRGG